jgi:alpha-glucosidase
VSFDNELKFSVLYNGQELIDPSPVSMELENMTLGREGKIVKKSTNSVDRVLTPVVRIKSEKVTDRYNELTLIFDKNYAFIVRAYNDGIGYRFETELGDSITVKKENARYSFNGNYTCWWAKEKGFHSNNQVYYDYTSLQELTSDDLGSLPLILNPVNGPKIVIAETDLNDYPGMWLRGADGTSLTVTNPAYPKKTKQVNDRDVFITEREGYIAKTSGTRTFPWRVFAIAAKDGGLITNQLTYLMASENELDDTSWIKPGKVSWDWWNANNIEGVDFPAGINTQTYKYYIDFAAKYGLEYIMLDEGWYKLGNLLDIEPDVDVKELVRYGKEKGVGVLLWVVWKTLDDQMQEALDAFKEWGVKGIKVDFMDKDDQWMVNYFHRVAKEAAKRHLLVDFHGSYKPAGLRRMYPNVMTREGVNGGEQYKWSYRQTPEHNLITPFGRMLAGPMDYTPGAMNNAQEKNFKPIFDRPMSMGTRCHQLAMFVCYESPLQMLCDAPSNYYGEPEAMEFLSAVPSVWDETVVLQAKVSDYLVVARRSGKKWFVGGMGDWNEHELEIGFSFLDPGKKYKMVIVQDGINANRIATDFKRIEKEVSSDDTMTIKMKKGGGWVAQIIPED